MLDNMVDDVMIVEGEQDADEQERAFAIQRLINNGCWKFQGSIGREMMRHIEAGRCMLGKNASTDYWGNRVPSRDDIKPGCMGTRSYVAERMGEKYAEELSNV